MNEFGKILGFWLVNGTNLREVEEQLRGIERRYQQHGFEGPFILTVDNSLQTKSFFVGSNNNKKKPVFPSLVSKQQNHLDEPDGSPIAIGDLDGYHDKNGGSSNIVGCSTVGGGSDPINAAALLSTQQQLSSVEIIQKQLALPSRPLQPSNMATAQTTAGTIAQKVKEQGNVLFVDLEWTCSSNKGPGVIGIGLCDGTVYLFHIPILGGIPSGIKTLLEEPTLTKVGNQFHNDIQKLREVNIEVKNHVELGKMAKQRGIFNRGNSSLSSQVEALLDCALPKDNKVHCSPWNQKVDLMEKQVEYVALDIYATRSVYLLLAALAWINPFVTPNPTQDELLPGVKVLVYARNCSQLVACAQVLSETPDNAFDQLMENKMVQIRICHSDIIAPIARPFVTTNGDTLGSLFQMFSSEPAPHVDIPQQWQCLRIMSEAQGENNSIAVCTEFITVTIEAGGAFSSEISNPSDDERYLAEMERIKNDIVHIFLCFQKVISSKHCCY